MRVAATVTHIALVAALLVIPVGPAVSQTAPANDDFANATVLAPGGGTLFGDTNVDATAEAGEPSHHGVTPSRSVWYSWTPGVDGNAIVEATTQPYIMWDIVIGVYTGGSLGALTEVASDGGLVNRVEVEFAVDAGVTYHLAVDGQTSSESGSFDLTWSIPSPPNDSLVNAAGLTEESGWLVGETNEWASAEPGEPAHAGRTATRSVWYRWAPPADGTAVITASMHGSDYIVMAAYTGVAVDALTEVAAHGGFGFSRVRLEFPVLGGTNYHIVLDGWDAGETGAFDLTWALSPPANDDFVDAVVLDERSGSLLGETTEHATPEIGEPGHGAVPGTPARSVWYEWTPIWDGDATIDVTTPAAPGDWDSVVAVYTGSALDALSEVDSASTTDDSVHLDFQVSAGATYRIVVDGHSTTEFGGFDLMWAYTPDGGAWTVTKPADTDDGACDADCSLREAVVAANNTGGDDTITLPAGNYELTLWAEGGLAVERETGTTSILGAGANSTIIDATPLGSGPGGVFDRWRVFSVDYHAGLELVGVTVTGGYTASGADKDGGGVYNFNGTLMVTDSIIEGNVSGENGGGIANYLGTATITNSIIRNNNTDPPEYRTTGLGGGIYNAGTLTIVGSMIELNEADYGGGVASEQWLLDEYPATLEVIGSVIDNNTARSGAGVANDDTAIITDSLITGNHATRSWDAFLNTANRGGGIVNSGDLTVVDSTISGNEVWAQHAVDPASGGGGGIANVLGDLTLVGSTLNGNTAICDQALPGDPDLCGRGGGLVNAGGVAAVVNTTVSGNTTDLLNSDHGAYLGGGGGGGVAHMPQKTPGSGGGWIIFCAVTVLDSVTITGNTAAHGGGINSRWESWGNGIYDVPDWEVGNDVYECPDLYVTNSIIAGNDATYSTGTEDSWGGYSSLGHNLVGDGTGAPSDGPGDLTTLDARLGPLADNGGSTLTHLPLKGSPAIDAGSTDEAFDQRSVGRPVGTADDIGAVEAPVYLNEPPMLDPIGSQWVAEGDTVDVMITASDSDGDPVGFFITGNPPFAGFVDHGDNTATLTLSPGYDDAASYPGVVIEASDGIASDSETITITVSDTNRAPTGDDQAVSTSADTPVAVTLTGADPDGDTLTYAIEVGPSHGSLSGTPPAVTYTPNPGYVGPDSFTFVVDDGDLTSVPATVSITVTPPPPAGSVTGVVRHEGAPLAGVEVWLGYGDRHMCTLGDGTFSFADVPAGEILVAVTGPAQVLPCANADFVNSRGQPLATQAWDHKKPNEPWDEFTLSPGEEKEVAFDVVLRQAPIAVDDFAAVDNGGAVTINVLGNDQNPEGYAVEIVKTSDPLHGAVTLQPGGTFLYSHDGSNTTADSFTYKLDDAVLESLPATVTITVHPPGNKPPVLDPIGDRLVAEGDTVEVKITASDPDGDTVGFVISANPPFAGFVDNGDDTATLTLSPGFDDAGTYPGLVIEASDGVDHDTETITITVSDTNRAPIAVADGAFNVARGDTLTVNGVLDNDTDPDGDPLTAVKSTDPEHGTVTLQSDGSFSYAHDGSAAASDSFTYRAFDGIDHSGVTTVAIVITDVLPDALEPTSVGLVDPSQGRWHLRDYTTGVVTSFFYGNPGDTPFMGDWDCDGVATPGLFRQSDAFAYLRNSNTVGIAHIRFFFGNPSDVPLAGDFDGDGCDSLSIYRPSEQRFYIMNELGENEGGLGAADFSFGFGNPGDKPVVGDWDGDGVDEVGLHRESSGFFYYRDALDTGIASGEFYFGDPGDRFIAGDWGTIDGVETPAVFRPGDTTFYFRWTNTPGNADSQFSWGETGWLPVSGVID